jgi:ankyrin repeat protein
MANLPAVKLLMERGAKVNAQTELGDTPLHLAAHARCKPLIEHFLQNGADASIANNRQLCATHIVAIEQNRELMDTLLGHMDEGDVGLDVPDEHQAMPLHYAAANGNVRVTHALLAAQAPVNAQDLEGRSPLHLAAAGGFRDVVMPLIVAQADVNLATKNGFTPLHLAVDHSHKQVIELLIQKGATVNSVARAMWTPIHAVGKTGDVEIARVLVNAGAKLESHALDGSTCLHVAAFHQHEKLVEYLLEQGAEADAVREEGWTPLHLACQEGDRDSAAALIAHGADPDARLKDTTFPLYIAAQHGHSKVMGRSFYLYFFHTLFSLFPSLFSHTLFLPLFITHSHSFSFTLSYLYGLHDMMQNPFTTQTHNQIYIFKIEAHVQFIRDSMFHFVPSDPPGDRDAVVEQDAAF